MVEEKLFENILPKNKTLPKVIAEILKNKTNFKNRAELLAEVKKYPGFENTNIKSITPYKIPTLGTVNYKSVIPITEEVKIERFGKEKLATLRKEGFSEKKLNNNVSSGRNYAGLSKQQKQIRMLRNKANLKNNPDLVNKDRIDSRERSRVRRSGEAKFYKVQKANSLVWNDFIRSAQSDDGLLKFLGNKPESGKRYNKVETEKFVFVDKNNNKIRYGSLMSDIKKAGLNAEKLFLPYRQKEYLAAEKITQELNKALGYTKAGSTKSVWNVQHVEGIGKSLDNVHLTFGTENLAEAGSRRTFDAAWKNATYVDKNGKTKVRHNDVGKIGDANYKSGGKTAIKNYYKSLGPNIVAQIGRKPVGTAPALTELLSRVKDAKGNIITSPNIERIKLELAKPDKADLDRLIEKQIKTVQRFTNKNGIKVNSFAGVVDLSQSGIKMSPAVRNALKTIVKYGGKTLRGVGKGAVIIDPIFAAFDASEASRKGATIKDTGKYVGNKLIQGLANLPGMAKGALDYGTDYLKGKRDDNLKFKTPYEYKFAEENLQEDLRNTPLKTKVDNMKQLTYDTGPGSEIIDDMDVPLNREQILQDIENFKNNYNLNNEQKRDLTANQGIMEVAPKKPSFTYPRITGIYDSEV